MITDKETNTVYFSEKLKTDPRFSKTFKKIAAALKKAGIQPELLPETKDIWVRDYMPVQVERNKFIEFRYDPDYLQGTRKGYRNLKTYPDIVCDTIGLKTIKSNIILDGGNVIKSNNCVILTDKVVKENRLQYTKQQLIAILKDLFEVDHIVLIPWDMLDEFGHADGMLRFIDERTVLVHEIYITNTVLNYRLKKAGLEVVPLKFDVRKKDKRNWAYINFLQTKNILLVPELGIDEDQQALEQISSCFSDYAKRKCIKQIRVSDILQYKGALNCISWSIEK